MTHTIHMKVRTFTIALLVLFLPEFTAQAQENNAGYSETIESFLVGENQFFRANNGQWDSDVLYQATGKQASVSFFKDRVSFTLFRFEKRDQSVTLPTGPDDIKMSSVSWSLYFESGNIARIIPSGKVDRPIHYFYSGKNKADDVCEYTELLYQNVYDGIDLKFYSASNGSLKYDFIVHPGADVNAIKMYYHGVKGLELAENGDLEIKTEWGKLSEKSPYSYQVVNGKKEEVQFDYAVDGNHVGFGLKGNYNPSLDVVIDPIYVEWSTYFYGSATQKWTWILAVDIDDNDNVYVGGLTSDIYPNREYGYDSSINSTTGYKAFICRLSPKGDSIVAFSYLGPKNVVSSWSIITNMVVNGKKQPVVSGITYAKDFPVTSGAFDTIGKKNSSIAYPYQGFVTKFTTNLDALVYSTFLTGKDGYYDWIRGMALNANGDVYVVGNTQSSDFPTTSGCFQGTYAGMDATGGTNYYTRGDAYMTCLSSDGSYLKFSTYIGGSKNESAYDVYVDENNEVYVVGTTSSGNFPTTPGASVFNSYIKGTSDAFVMKFKSNGNQLIFSKLMGGSQDDAFEGIYANASGEPFIAGYSNSSDFYTTSKAYQRSNAGGYDYVIVKMISSGTNVRYSTYLGGSGNEYYYSYPYFKNVKITANVKEEAIISGISQSGDFPVTSDALQKTNVSKWVSFKQNLTLSKLSYGGDKLMYATYFGGTTYEWPGAIKTKRVGCVSYIISGGVTYSDDYPTTDSVYKDEARKYSSGWTYSGFVTKFRDTLYTEPITLGFEDTIIECDAVFEILDASNQGADFTWSDGWTDRYHIVQDSGTLWVRATYGCDTVGDTITIQLEHSPTVPVFANDTTYCDNFPVTTLDAKNDTIYRSYLWHDGSTNQTFKATKEGKYWVDISTPHCGTKTDTITFKLLKTPVVDIGSSSTECDSVRLTLDAGNPNNECIYKWSTGDSVQSISVKDTGDYKVVVSNFCGTRSDSVRIDKQNTPVAVLPADSVFCNKVNIKLIAGDGTNGEKYEWTSFDGTKNYSKANSYNPTSTQDIRLKVSNSCGSDMDSIRLTLINTPVEGLKDTVLACDNVSETFKIGTADNEETYSWSNGGTTNEISVNTPGKYVGVSTNKCGSDSSSFEIFLSFKPTVKLPNDTTYCGTVNVVLNAKSQDPDMQYAWQDGSSNASFNATSAGSYKVKLTNRCGTISDSVTFKLLQKPSFELGNDRVFCGGVTPFDLTIGTSGNEEVYEWYDGNTTNKSTIAAEGKFWAKASNQCGEISDTMSVKISQYPVVDLGPDTILCGNFNITLDAGNPGMSYEWMPFAETTQTIQATEQVVYSVKVTNADGCSSSDEFEIGSGCVSHFYIPNSFSPNKDGFNETFKPTLINYEQYTLSIYDRWGELLFSTENADEGWDGTYEDKAVPAGVYLYSMRFITTEDGEFRNISGLVHIVY
ncbi:MAG: T9SS type B sorting domain-containing protein [Bacteroidetes bacterium]|nr:T9SS type B sorting domain-containing protein [Bacteroidota bacterium]